MLELYIMVHIYTDGAARNNPGKAGWGVVIVDTDQKIVTELGGASPHATNNQMELTGAIEALFFVSQEKKYKGQKIALYTDSAYVIRGMKQWVKTWQKNGWQTSQKKDVENVRLWQKLLELSSDKDIEWLYVPGHSGVPWNERTDVIATSFADGKLEQLFVGAVEAYPYDISVSNIVKRTGSKSKTLKAGYYIVVKNGVLARYETWIDCEREAKGTKGVRFKKVANKEEEEKFLKHT